MKNQIIQEAFVVLNGEPDVGIPSSVLTITDIHFDLNAFAEEDQEKVVDQFRKKLSEAFEIAWGEKPTVTFDVE